MEKLHAVASRLIVLVEEKKNTKIIAENQRNLLWRVKNPSSDDDVDRRSHSIVLGVVVLKKFVVAMSRCLAVDLSI